MIRENEKDVIHRSWPGSTTLCPRHRPAVRLCRGRLNFQLVTLQLLSKSTLWQAQKYKVIQVWGPNGSTVTCLDLVAIVTVRSTTQYKNLARQPRYSDWWPPICSSVNSVQRRLKNDPRMVQWPHVLEMGPATCRRVLGTVRQSGCVVADSIFTSLLSNIESGSCPCQKIALSSPRRDSQ